MALGFRSAYFEGDEGVGSTPDDSRQYEVGHMSFTDRKRAICDGVSMAMVAITLLMFSVAVMAEELNYGRLLEPVTPMDKTLEPTAMEVPVQARGWIEVVNGEKWVWTGETWQVSD